VATVREHQIEAAQKPRNVSMRIKETSDRPKQEYDPDDGPIKQPNDKKTNVPGRKEITK
jgi:hypothetical protein